MTKGLKGETQHAIRYGWLKAQQTSGSRKMLSLQKPSRQTPIIKKFRRQTQASTKPGIETGQGIQAS